MAGMLVSTDIEQVLIYTTIRHITVVLSSYSQEQDLPSHDYNHNCHPSFNNFAEAPELAR